MGKQSARMYYQGKDHKDIYFHYNYHDAMYKGSNLVWKKIYPDRYFFSSVEDFYLIKGYLRSGITLMFSGGSVEEKLQSYALRYGEHVYAFADSSIVIRMRFNGKKRAALTKDLRNFKLIDISAATAIETVGNSFFSFTDRKIFSVDDEMNYHEIECELPRVPTKTETLTDCIYFGNYAILYLVSDNKGYYEIVDEKGNINEFSSTLPTYSDNASFQEYVDKRYMRYSDIKIVLGDYIYYYVPSVYAIQMTYHSRGRFVKRSLLDFSITPILDAGYDNNYVDAEVLFQSKEKVVFIMGRDDETDPSKRYAHILRINKDGSISDKIVKNLSIKVYGEDRTIDIIPINEEKNEIEKDKIYLRDVFGETEYFGVSNGGFPTLMNGRVKLDVIDGMLIYFTYGDPSTWQIVGYMYIDNFDFSESENNYIYIIFERVDGQLIYDRYGLISD